MSNAANWLTETESRPMPGAALKVGGYTPFSSTDYPGQLAAVVFVQGCPWRCGYCHNPHLQPRSSDRSLIWDTLWRHLHRRAGLLDAVVFSGGEPTLDPALPHAMRQVRALGYKIGLHTAGCYPRRLTEVLPLLDWVGLDVKGSPHEYDTVTQTPGSSRPVQDSLRLLLDSGINFEVRTTEHPEVHTPSSLLALARGLRSQGVQRYALQTFRSIGCTQETLIARPAGTPSAARQVAPLLQTLFPNFTLREG